MKTAASSLRTACADLNGQMRGTRLAAEQAAQLEFAGQRLPLSILALDFWGDPLTDGDRPLAVDTPAGQLRCTDRDPVPLPWLDEASTLAPMWMYTEDGAPFAGDPRHALARVLDRFKKRRWSVTVSATLEFTLVDDASGQPKPASEPPVDAPHNRPSFAGIAGLDGFAAFFDALYAGAEAMQLPLVQSVSSAGTGQFALDLAPGPALRTADDLWLLKALVSGTADRQDLCATFMAKPFAGEPGNGLHLRFLVRDGDGRNLFDNGLMTGSSVMRQAVAGCVAGMPGSTLIYAPYANSYSRVEMHSDAPVGASWGYENRTTALRIPGGDPANRQIEHRAPGADANPYLASAAMLGTALMGIEDDLTPPAPIIGDAYSQRILQTPTDWNEAIERFAVSPKMARIFPPLLIDLLTDVKRQEQTKLARLSPDQQVTAMLRTA